ncbi:TIM barrel protein [Paenibacillus doosanensis]|uniref:D-tagatose 3-epimerase n=1 Tax=Paenibacillus konkukensis TaxID=2020716 RepID=A0ABY4RSR6_9BACL|nr:MULTISPECIES: TIM barrel protein [Paenibacillus]MCS7464225.1 TIM barrel protein [Paenibacillus doosanensis]UQZ85584.1 D-tagatose 3-epimerase [Paenibacillus konkukensis]
MKLANMNQNYHRYPLEYFLDSTVRTGLEAIELWAGTPHLYVDDASAQEVAGVLKQIKQRNLELVCFTPEQAIYPINLSAKDDACRKRSIEYFRKCISVTNALECPKMLVIVGFGFYSEPEEEAWKRAAQSLHVLAQDAEQSGVTLVLESMSNIGSNVIYNLDTLQRMHAQVNSPAMKVMLDTIPMVLAGETIEEYGAAFGNELVHVHFLDGDGLTTAHLAWGEGKFSLDNFIDGLKTINYNGYLTLEHISPKYNWDPEAAVRQSLKSIGSKLLSQ